MPQEESFVKLYITLFEYKTNAPLPSY
jgi:hypothetical protein